MANLINRLKRDFTQIPNDLINDENIDVKARFLFVWLCSKPEDWKYYNKTIEKNLKMSKDTRIKYMRELGESGWISVEQMRGDDGSFGANDIILNPYPKKPDTVKNPCPKKTAAEKNGVGKITPHNKSNTLSNIKPLKKTETLFDGVELVDLPEMVLDYLNTQLKGKDEKRRGFGPTAGNLKHIKALLKNKKVKYTLEDFKRVVDSKIIEWYGKPKTEIWLRPKTLFGDNFDSYLTQSDKILNKTNNNWGNRNFVEAEATENDLK